MPSATAPFLSGDSVRHVAEGGARPQAFRTAARIVVPVSADCAVMLLLGLTVSWVLSYFPPDIANLDVVALEPPTIRVLVVLTSIACYLAIAGRYGHRASPARRLRFTAGVVLYAAVVDVALSEAGSGRVVSCIPDLAALFLLPPGLTMAGLIAAYALQRLGCWFCPVLVAGDEAGMAATEAALKFHHRLGYQVAGKVYSSELALNLSGGTLRSVLALHDAECIVIAASDRGQVGHKLAEAAACEGIPFGISWPISSLCRSVSGSSGLITPDAFILWPGEGVLRMVRAASKIVIDVVLSLMILLLVSPALFVLAFIVRLDGGPALFRHRRLGLQGRHFHCLKFRTMVVDAEQALQHALANDPGLNAEWNETHKLKNDPRVTRIGSFLRRFSLDELPQLFNVLRLEMSLVGPRPITDAESRRYGERISYYYAARPGMTGLWQVSGRSNTTYEQRVQLDVQYVKGWSLWHDFVLLFRTIPVVLNHEGAH